MKEGKLFKYYLLLRKEERVDMKKRIIRLHSLSILIIIAMFVIVTITQLTFIPATETLGVFKQYDCVELRQICSNCSYNNISSVLYPNVTQALGEVVMTRTGTNYVYNFCNTSVLGNYIVNGYGNVEGILTVWSYDFQITTTGNNSPYAIPLFIGLAAFILLIFSFAIKNHYVTFISGTLFIVLGIYMMVYGLGIMSDFYTQTLAYVSLGIGLLLILAGAYSAINDSNINLFGGGRGDDDDF